MFVPGSYQDLYDHFGNPAHSDFNKTYIVTIKFLKYTVECHKVIYPLLKDISDKLIAEKKEDLVHSYDGCYVVRSIRGETKPSLHSWGLAIDLNAYLFPLGSVKRQDHILTQLFIDHKFFYGGDFYHRKDPMHYQFTKPHTI